MTYKVGDLVYFDGIEKGIGKVVAIDGMIPVPYLVHSTSIKDRADGTPYVEKQDNNNNSWFMEHHLKPFTKKVGQKYKALVDYGTFRKGEIITLVDVNAHESIGLYENDGGYRWRMNDLDHNKCEVEFYAEAQSAKENEMFTKNDLEVGYMVKLINGQITHIVNTQEEGLCLNFVEGWTSLDNYNRDLNNTVVDTLDIIEVYGYTKKGVNAHKFETGNRELLWKREEVKEMTIEEIQKALGHKIKVVE